MYNNKLRGCHCEQRSDEAIPAYKSHFFLWDYFVFKGRTRKKRKKSIKTAEFDEKPEKVGNIISYLNLSTMYKPGQE